MRESDVHDGLTVAALTACVEAAVAAPSIHNSQPWRFRIRDGGIDVFADWDRQLRVIDPSGRELLISIGAAVFNLRVAMRHHGLGTGSADGGRIRPSRIWSPASCPGDRSRRAAGQLARRGHPAQAHQPAAFRAGVGSRHRCSTT